VHSWAEIYLGFIHSEVALMEYPQFENRDFVKEPLQVLSFGGGIQSTAMLLLAVQGKIAPPDIILHADTGSEMPYTEPHVERCRLLAVDAGIPFEIITSPLGRLHEYYQENGSLPILGFRSCTGRFKIEPINKRIRELVGKGNGRRLATSWIGISLDEKRRRVTKGKYKWIGNSYPLLDEVMMTRDECIQYIEKAGLGTKKSACFCCPYGGMKEFKALKISHPELFEICLEMEASYFEARPEREWGLIEGWKLDSIDMPSLSRWGFEIPEVNCDPAGGCFL